MEPTEIAWFAGLFEGEGSSIIEKNGNTKLVINSTDADIIDRCKAMFPNCHNVKPKQPKPAKAGYGIPKVQYSWRVGRPEEVRRILNLILPYLGQRRTKKALEVLAHLDARPLKSYQRRKTHCPQGHEYSESNTRYYGPKNYRQCRTCQRLWWTAYNTKRKSQSQGISA